MLKNKSNEDNLQRLKVLNQKLEEEKKHLENKVVELQVSVARSQVNVNKPGKINEIFGFYLSIKFATKLIKTSRYGNGSSKRGKRFPNWPG